MDPSSPIEKHFVLPPILYGGCQHILLSIASYCHTQELTQQAKKWLAKSDKLADHLIVSHLNSKHTIIYMPTLTLLFLEITRTEE